MVSVTSDIDVDVVVVGGGIVGISTAWQLQQRFPDKSVVVVEKEPALAAHQTGHNSGVIHAGVYYEPGSRKAEFCKAGASATIKFCRRHHLKFAQCGKLLVATNVAELQRMERLQRRCSENGLDVERLDSRQLQQLEPNIVGVGALRVLTTAIVNYQHVANKMADCFTGLGGRILTGSTLIAIDENPQSVTLAFRPTQDRRPSVASLPRTITARLVVVCAGLQADRVAKLAGLPPTFQIVPYRGEYYRLAGRLNTLINHLIYPIPDPALPFLGVHLTRMIDGSITVGPNALQGWKREGYGRINIDPTDVKDLLRFPGFYRVAKKHFRTGVAEWRDSVWKRGYLRRVQKYCPSLTVDDLEAHPAGVRAQAVLRDGTLVSDFLFAETSRTFHVCNAPSPAATSALPIGAHIIDHVINKL